MRLAIGFPNTGMVHSDFATSLASMVHYSIFHAQDVQFVGLVNMRTSCIEKGRHDIVEMAFSLDADKLLFLDTDMVFPIDTIERLAKYDKEIVGCDYLTRHPPLKNTARDKDKDLIDPSRTGLTEVGFLATGCLMVSMCVFKQIGKPYFRVHYDEAHNSFIGEDYIFCERARGEGFRIWCDHDLSKKVQHIGDYRYNLEQFVNWKGKECTPSA